MDRYPFAAVGSVQLEDDAARKKTHEELKKYSDGPVPSFTSYEWLYRGLSFQKWGDVLT